jgi:predicted aspartyl protease
MKKSADTELTRGELALLRGAARAKQAHQSAHEAMRARLKETTTTVVACLQELRVQHAGDGHFVNNIFVPAQVSRRDVELAFRQSEGEKKR